MKRRTFLQSSLAASCFPLAAASYAAAADSSGRQFLEWRRYVISNETQHALVSDFLKNAVVPGLKRQDIGPVGVFTEIGDDASLSIYTLVPFQSLDQMLQTGPQLSADAEFMTAASDYLNTEKDHPAYQRIESQLMISFIGFPQVQTPRSGERMFELRVYESHNEYKAMLKIEMFNEAEFAIFRNVGLDGVFFGQTLCGSNMPNLTYMLAYTDMADHDRAWAAFRDDPDWQTLRGNERYKDTVSNIVSRFMKPTEYSQI